ncbi:GNAT family N-acetyltransferase [Lewinella sp. 4G2]|uniref:GNAT family N-acetyltransferase n=1 Tax=Lewinella sp. 4G2 TaxID=1803372 RepID=UPI0007B49CF2|nr:GNAT family N-acetyltransferase [Lewinella sp. 4G2]OAV45178.1 acyl-CoA acyltransferase [Lewinella sp. 4G2]
MEVTLTIEDTKGTAHVGPLSDPTAHMEFSIAGPQLIIISHTEVGESLRGQGVGRQLLDKVVEHARANGIKIMPLCPYAKSVFDKDPSIGDVLK